MFLARHKTTSSGTALPAQSERFSPEGTAASLSQVRIVAVGWPVPLAALVFTARPP